MKMFLTSKLDDDVKVKIWNNKLCVEKDLYAGSRIDCCLPNDNVDKIFIQAEYSYDEISNPVLRVLFNVIWGCIYYIFQCFMQGESGSFKSEQRDRYVAVISGEFNDDTALNCICEADKNNDECYRIKMEGQSEYKLEHKIKVDKEEMNRRLRHWKTKHKIVFFPGALVCLLCFIIGILKNCEILSIICGIVLILMSVKLYKIFKVAETECNKLCKQSEENILMSRS